MSRGQENIADYDPEGGRRGSLDVAVRNARSSDIPQIARIALEREGGTLDGHVEGATRELQRFSKDADAGLLVVAEWDSKVVGFGRVSYNQTPDGASEEDFPEGYYLSGVIVDPVFRRWGIGSGISRRRISWVADRASIVRYFASLENRASIAMHEKLGFREVRRQIAHPRIRFTGGVGALYELTLEGRE